MDSSTLAKDLVAFLIPFIPYLIKAGEKTSEEIGKRLGVQSWERAKKIWELMYPKIKSSQSANDSLTEIINNPGDSDAEASLRFQFKKLMQANRELAKQVEDIIINIPSSEKDNLIHGNRNIVVGNDISNSILISGDKNVIGK